MSNSEGQRIKVVFFDLGFTLINFVDEFHNAMNESYIALARSLIQSGCTFSENEFASKYREIITNYYHVREIDLIERPVEESLHKSLEYFQQDALSEEAIQHAIETMFSVTESYWQIETDSHETLKSLKTNGYRLGLISNASNSRDLNQLIDQHHLRIYFDQIVISAEEKIRKPDSRIYLRALDRMHVEANQCVMVGDTLTADILGAQQVGLCAIWIDRRAKRPENEKVMERIHPDYIIHDLASLPPLLEQLQKSLP